VKVIIPIMKNTAAAARNNVYVA